MDLEAGVTLNMIVVALRPMGGSAAHRLTWLDWDEPLSDSLRASEKALTAVRTGVSAGRCGPCGAKLGVLTAGHPHRSQHRVPRSGRLDRYQAKQQLEAGRVASDEVSLVMSIRQ
jgi:hypothetical protein